MASARANITHPRDVNLDLSTQHGRSEAMRFRTQAANAARDAERDFEDTLTERRAARLLGRQSPEFVAAALAHDDTLRNGLRGNQCEQAWDVLLNQGQGQGVRVKRQ